MQKKRFYVTALFRFAHHRVGGVLRCRCCVIVLLLGAGAVQGRGEGAILDGWMAHPQAIRKWTLIVLGAFLDMTGNASFP